MPRSAELARFSRAERWVHRLTALLMGACMLTAAALTIAPLSELVGRRALIAAVHVFAGLALPLPVLAGWLSPSFRNDLRRLNRFVRSDGEWLRRGDRRTAGLPVGKFNAGQKLNAAFTAGAILVMLGTGVIMAFGQHWSLSLRIGATFVHDWLAAAVVVVVAGHLYFAFGDPMARRGMRRGTVAASWARREHPAWAAEEAANGETTATTTGGATATGGEGPGGRAVDAS